MWQYCDFIVSFLFQLVAIILEIVLEEAELDSMVKEEEATTMEAEEMTDLATGAKESIAARMISTIRRELSENVATIVSLADRLILAANKITAVVRTLTAGQAEPIRTALGTTTTSTPVKGAVVMIAPALLLAVNEVQISHETIVAMRVLAAEEAKISRKGAVDTARDEAVVLEVEAKGETDLVEMADLEAIGVVALEAIEGADLTKIEGETSVKTADPVALAAITGVAVLAATTGVAVLAAIGVVDLEVKGEVDLVEIGEVVVLGVAAAVSAEIGEARIEGADTGAAEDTEAAADTHEEVILVGF